MLNEILKGIGLLTVASIAATTLMSAFSYGISKLTRMQFREPVLINLLLSKSNLLPVTSKFSLWGYSLHYLVGFLLALIYRTLVEYAIIRIDLLSGLIFGGISGFIAVGVWKMLFVVSPDPPTNNQVGYFIQLIIAHLIFGSTLAFAMEYIQSSHLFSSF